MLWVIYLFVNFYMCLFFLGINIFVLICLFGMCKKVMQSDKLMGITLNEINIFVIVHLSLQCGYSNCYGY